MKLYNGKTLPGFTADNIKELKKEADAKGCSHFAPLYQDKISNALLSDMNETCVNPFMVLRTGESGPEHSLITSEGQRPYKNCWRWPRKGYENNGRRAAGHLRRRRSHQTIVHQLH
jgi:serine protein kinase